jgi:hypothetical protein
MSAGTEFRDKISRGGGGGVAYRAKTRHCKGTQASGGKTPRILTLHIRPTQGTNFTPRILHAWGKNPQFQPDKKTAPSRYGCSEEGTVPPPSRFEVQSSIWASSIIIYHHRL